MAHGRGLSRTDEDAKEKSLLGQLVSTLALDRYMLLCCNVQHEHSSVSGEMKVVQLMSDDTGLANPVHLLTEQDSFDVTVSPRAGAMGDWTKRLPMTPRQHDFRDRIQLPRLLRYPLPPDCLPDEPEDKRRAALLQVFQDFVLDLHRGMHMTQISSSQEYSDIHCQILEDLQTLKIDQGSGCIIEFPLIAVSKVYRIVKNDDRWFSAGSLTGPTPMPPLPLSNAEHIVVVEFMKRKLAFVFCDIVASQRFLMCMELLIRRAQEHDVRLPKNTDSLIPMFAGSLGHKKPGERFAQPNRPVPAEETRGLCSCDVKSGAATRM
ncbi:unnamed protein product [Effrenium voratum]|nr:unnamed protein product [Effrenium voratum]